MLEIGSLIDNKYRILDVIGEGGMSIVYLARNESTKINWAIKEIKKLGEEDMEVKRSSLIAEIEMLKKLHNDYLPTIIDVIDKDDTYLIVMDLIEGNDLDVKLAQEGALPQEDVIKWAKQLCNVLNYLHTREPAIIYRDMKPGNIMLKPDGNISVIDFGTAREIEIKNVRNTKSLGTEGYAAPEQYGENAYADERTDIYNFGATIFHLITGEYPDPFRIFEHPIRDYNSALSGGIENIIIKCTQPNPEKRYQTCKELAFDLDNYDIVDSEYLALQKRKLTGFIISAVLCVLCFCFAFFGYFQNTNQIQAKYDEKIRSEQFADAIMLDDTRIDGYLGLIQYCSKDGEIDDDDIKTLSMFESYEDNGKNSNGEEISPISDLASNNISNYIEVCYSLGEEYWELYKTPYSRATKAAPWFKRILPDNYLDIQYKDYTEGDSYQITVSGVSYNITIGDDETISLRQFQVALVGAQINNCKDNITAIENAGSSFNSFSSEDKKEKAYQDLWEQLQNLYYISENMSDSQLVIILCNEICIELESHLEGIAVYNNLKESDISDELLLPLKSTLQSLNSNSNAEDLLSKLDSVSKYISEYYGG